MKIAKLSAVVAAMLISGTAFAQATVQIHTGGAKGSYYLTLAPLLSKVIGQSLLNTNINTSPGSAENIARVLKDPAAIGMVQGDVLAAFSMKDPAGYEKLEVLRSDIANECLFAVVKKENAAKIPNWSAVNRHASRIRLSTGDVGSGPASTIEYLKSMDTEQKGLGLLKEKNEKDVDAALAAVQNNSAHVAFFVQYADPKNPRFKQIVDNGMTFIPVLSKDIVNAKVGGKEVYSVYTVEVTEGGMITPGLKIDTVCTPVVYVTGKETLFTNGGDRRNQADKIADIKNAPATAFLPQDGFWANLKKVAIKKSGEAVTKIMIDVDAAANAAREQMK